MLTDILLRELTHGTAQTKGDTLTWDELDQNQIELLDAILALQANLSALSGNIAPWDATTNYAGGTTQYVSYAGNIYKLIKATDSLNEQPDVTPLSWELSSIGAAVAGGGEPNQFVGNTYVNSVGGTASITSQRKNTMGCTVSFAHAGSEGEYIITTSDPRFEDPRRNYIIEFFPVHYDITGAPEIFQFFVTYIDPSNLKLDFIRLSDLQHTGADALLDGMGQMLIRITCY